MLPVLNRNWFPALFDDFFDSNDFLPRFNTSTPAVNVKENGKEFVMEVAAPGIKKEFCRVNVNSDGHLEVSIENKMEHKEENKENKEGKKDRYLRREFAYTNYKQSYRLPENVDKDHITAKVEDGVLVITLPKFTPEEESKAQRLIEVR